MRKVINLHQKDRIRSYKGGAKIFGASAGFESAGDVHGIRALRSNVEGGYVSIHVRNHGRSAQGHIAQLFSFARAIGDAACFPSPSRSPVNELHSAYRQAAGRAFAAEFLAPVDEIESMRADGYDPVAIANELSVSTTTIERQIENGGRIRSASV